MLRRLPHCRHGEDGFALPLALTGSLVMLLSSLSLISVTVQSRARLQAQWLQRQHSDALASAGQQLAVQLAGPWQCLLRELIEECGAAVDPAKLLPSTSPAQVSQWLPLAPGSVQVRLQMRDATAAGSYVVGFDPTLGRVVQMRSLGQ